MLARTTWADARPPRPGTEDTGAHALTLRRLSDAQVSRDYFHTHQQLAELTAAAATERDPDRKTALYLACRQLLRDLAHAEREMLRRGLPTPASH